MKKPMKTFWKRIEDIVGFTCDFLILGGCGILIIGNYLIIKKDTDALYHLIVLLMLMRIWWRGRVIAKVIVINKDKESEQEKLEEKE